LERPPINDAKELANIVNKASGGAHADFAALLGLSHKEEIEKHVTKFMKTR
jgi:dihydroorotase-like cyclic amidohydrolase